MSSGIPAASGLAYFTVSVLVSLSPLKANFALEKKSIELSLVTSLNLSSYVAHLSGSTFALSNFTEPLCMRFLLDSSCAAVVRRYLTVMVPPPSASSVASSRHPESIVSASAPAAQRSTCGSLAVRARDGGIIRGVAARERTRELAGLSNWDESTANESTVDSCEESTVES